MDRNVGSLLVKVISWAASIVGLLSYIGLDFQWFRSKLDEHIDVLAFQDAGPWILFAGALGIAASEAPRIMRWWRRRGWGTTPLKGVDELERCQQALIKYMEVPIHSPISEAEIAATGELLPHVHALIRVLDEQDVPHPKLDAGIVFTGTVVWRDFLAQLWAVRDDEEKARQVYQGDEKSG